MKLRGLLRREPQALYRDLLSDAAAELLAPVFSPQLIRTIWVAERCIQMNAQQIASMPLRFQPGAPNSQEPAWLSNPDPAWFPNGIADAIFAAVDAFYRWGDAFLYLTSFYASGFPSGWTVLDSSQITVTLSPVGRREFRTGSTVLDPARVVQISRNPRGALRGTSALQSYAEMVTAQSRTMTAGNEAIQNTPSVVLQSKRKIDKTQAELIQVQFVEGGANRRPGSPPVMPPEIDLLTSNVKFSPKDLALIEQQEFNARVLASAFGVPPFKLNLPLTGGLTYQNPAMLRDQWWWDELQPSAHRITAAMTANMLPRGSAVAVDPTNFLRQELPGNVPPLDSPTIAASPTQDALPPVLRPVPMLTG